MSDNEYGGGSDPFTGNGNPGRENNRQKNRNKTGYDVNYSDRLKAARERGLPKVGLYEPMDTSRLKTRPVQRAWEKVGPNGRIGSGLRRSRPYQGPTNANRSLTQPRDYEGHEPYQLTYLNHSGFIHSSRKKRRPSSAPPSRADGPRQPSRSPTPRSYTPKPPSPIQDDRGTFTYEDPRVAEDPYPKAREYVPTKIPTKQQNKAPPKPKVAPKIKKPEPKKGSKGPTPRSKETPPKEVDPQTWDPVIPIHANSFHAQNPTLEYDPYRPFETHPPQEIVPDPFPFANHPLLPSTPPPVSTPRFTPRYDDPSDFTPNPIYTYPQIDPSPPPPVRYTPVDPINPPQSKYVTPKPPKLTPSIQPKTPRRIAPKPKVPRVPPETYSPPAPRPTPKPKPTIPRKFPPKKPLTLQRTPFPRRTPPEATPHPVYAPPSRQNVSYIPTTPPYSPPAPQTPPTARRSNPRRELTPSPPPPPQSPVSRIPQARLQPPPVREPPYRKAPSPSIYAPPSRTPRPRSRHDLPEIRTPPRSRRLPTPTDDYDDFPDYARKDPLPAVFQPQRSPDPQSHPIRRTYYPPTLGLEKERLHSMGTIMRSMAMYRHRGGAGTWSFRT